MSDRVKGARTGAEVCCQVPGCSEDVPVKSYYRRCKICPHHMNLPVLKVDGKNMRFCKLCRRFEDILLFDGSMKSCRESLNRHNARRRQKRHSGAAIEEASPESSENKPTPPRHTSSDATAGEREGGRGRGGRAPAAQAGRPLAKTAVALVAATNSSLLSEAAERQAGELDRGQLDAAAPSTSAAQQLLPWWQLTAAAAAEASSNEVSRHLLPGLAPARGSTGGPGGSSARAGAGAARDGAGASPRAALGSNALADLPLLLASSTGGQDWSVLLAGMSAMLEGVSGGRQEILVQQPGGAEEEEGEQGRPQQRRRLESSAAAARFAFSPMGGGMAARPPAGDAGGRSGDRGADVSDDGFPAAMSTSAKLASLTLGDISAMLNSVGPKEMREWLLEGMACAPQRQTRALEHLEEQNPRGPDLLAQERRQGQEPTQKQEQAGDGPGAHAHPAVYQGGPAPALDLAGVAPAGADGRAAPGNSALEAFDTSSLKLNSLTLGELSMLMTSLGAKEMQDWLPGLLEGMSSWQQLQGEAGSMGQIPGSPEQPLQLVSRTSMEMSGPLAAAGSRGPGEEPQQLQLSQGRAPMLSMPPLPSTLKRRSLVLRPGASGSSAGSDWGGAGRALAAAGQEQQQPQQQGGLGAQAAASPWAAAALLGVAPSASLEKGGQS